MLVHVIVELIVSRDPDTNELFVSCIGNLVAMLVEDLDDIIPLVKVLLRAKPSENL
jgi:hypothetical protein